MNCNMLLEKMPTYTPDIAIPYFYVVSERKLWLLFILTFGLYSLYWFYQQWRAWRAFTEADISAGARTVFTLFFTHNLFNKIYQSAKAKYPHQKIGESLNIEATILVICLIISHVLGSGIGAKHLILWFCLMLLANMGIGWSLARTQRLANIASGDVNGESNHKLSLENYLCLFGFGLVWILLIRQFFILFIFSS